AWASSRLETVANGEAERASEQRPRVVELTDPARADVGTGIALRQPDLVRQVVDGELRAPRVAETVFHAGIDLQVGGEPDRVLVVRVAIAVMREHEPGAAAAFGERQWRNHAHHDPRNAADAVPAVVDARAAK